MIYSYQILQRELKLNTTINAITIV